MQIVITAKGNETPIRALYQPAHWLFIEPQSGSIDEDMTMQMEYSTLYCLREIASPDEIWIDKWIYIITSS